MKHKKTILLMLGLFACFITAIYSVCFTTMADSLHRVTAVTPISYTDRVEFYGNIFTIDNTYTALCMDRSKNTPQVGTIVDFTENDNMYIKKILYYGYGGPMEWHGFSGENEAILVTSIMLSQEYSGNGYKSICDEFRDYLDTVPALPEYNLSFSENVLSAYIENGVQRTNVITLTGDSRLSITLSLTPEMTLHHSDGNTYNGDIILHGGDSFYISAPVSSKGIWSSGELSVNETMYRTIIASCQGDSIQNLGYLIPDSGTMTTGLSVQWMNMGYIEITKQSSNPEISTGNVNYSLSNAIYNIYSLREDAENSVNPIASIITDSTGYGKSTDLPFGTYYIKEAAPPMGYELSDEITEIEVNSSVSSPVRLYDSPYAKPIEIKKYGEVENNLKSPLWGAGFMFCPVDALSTDNQGNYIWDDNCAIPVTEDGKKELFTNSGGYAITIPLPYGTYLVKETTVPKNYLPMEDTLVTIDQNSNQNGKMIYLTDKSFKAYIKISKEDSSTNTIILDNPATFKIWSFESEKYVSFEINDNGKIYVIEEFCTDNTGTLITPEPLMPGKYLIEEICPPDGYYLNSASKGYVLDISDNLDYDSFYENGTPVEGVGVFAITIQNTPVTKKIKLIKELEDPQNTGAYIPGAGISFNIYANEDIFSPGGNKILLYKKGELVEVLTTNEYGICETSDALPLGTYKIEEVNVPAGYEKTSENIITISRNATEQPDDTEEVTLHITNKLKPPIVLGETYTPSTGDNIHIAVIIFFLSILSSLFFLFKKIIPNK